MSCINLVATTASEPKTPIVMRFEALGGSASQIRAIKSSDTGFSLRELQFNALITLHLLSPITLKDLAEVERAWRLIRACASDRVYVGYRARELGEDMYDYDGTLLGQGPKAIRAYHGDHYDYLQAAHKTVDPQNVFWYPQAFRIPQTSQ